MKSLINFSLLFALSFGTANLMAAETIQLADPDSANLVIYRPLKSSNSTYYRISVDGQAVGKLKRGKTIHLKLAPGDHVISANDRDRTSQVVSVNGNGITYVKNEIDRRQRLSFEVQKQHQQGSLAASMN